MTTSPTGKKPQDHQKSTAAEEREREQERAELLAGMPTLKPAHDLRYRERARIKEIVALAVGKGLSNETGGIDIDVTTDEGRDRLSTVYDVCGAIDDFAANIAVDRAAYDEWSKDKDEAVFFAILSLYNEAVGESNGS